MDSELNNCIVINVQTTVAGSKRIRPLAFNVVNFAIDSLWYRAVQNLQNRSALTPSHASRASVIRQIFADRLDEETRENLKLQASSFSRESLQKLLRDIDLQVGTFEGWTDTHKCSCASTWRSFLVAPPDFLADNSPISDVLLNYSSPLKSLKNRQIPSKLAGRTFSNNLVSNIKHDSPEDLLEKARADVDGRIHSIAHSCEVDIQKYEELCQYQESLLSISISQDVRAQVIRRIERNSNLTGWGVYDEATLAAVCLGYIDSVKYFAVGPSGMTYDNTNFKLPGPIHLPNQLLIDIYQQGRSAQQWFFARYRLPSPVMTAMFLLLLCRTSWNMGSLGQMTTEGIQRKDGRLTLQGFKTKTDDDTPTYEVRRNDLLVQKIIVMLERNLEQLIAHKIVPMDEKRIWFGWQDTTAQEVKNHVSQTCISLFCERHQIPWFVPSELRPLNAASTYLQDQDLHAVQMLLGHSMLDTSESYLNQTLFFHLNEAKALQYQRVIEATIVFATKGDSALISMKIDENMVDSELLFPTGDGGTCSNPFDPPAGFLNGNKTCDGQRCHLNAGCRNYRLIIDARMLELAIRTRELYRSRWLDMLDKNEANFRKIHIPRIVFIHVLLKVVAEKKPSLLRSAIAAIDKEGVL